MPFIAVLSTVGTSVTSPTYANVAAFSFSTEATDLLYRVGRARSYNFGLHQLDGFNYSCAVLKIGLLKTSKDITRSPVKSSGKSFRFGTRRRKIISQKGHATKKADETPIFDQIGM